MISFSSWNGVKLHAHQHLLTEVLKGELGFSGFLVSDWGAIDQISADYYKCVVTSINAGLDMIMVPFNYQRFISTLEQAVDRGDVPIDRIIDAVGRIMTVKYELGLFNRRIDNEPNLDMMGSTDHRHLAREAVRKSLVLLKNDQNTIPLDRSTGNIIVAGPAGENVGLQCGGWTIEWQGGNGDITPGTTLIEAIRKTVSPGTTIHYDPHGNFPDLDRVDVGIVCIHEPPYAEGVGDRADLSLSVEETDLIERVRSLCNRLLVIIFSGRPLIITRQLPLAEAWIAAWLPGTEAQGITDVLFGDHSPVGKLPYTWPESMTQIPLGSFEFVNDGTDNSTPLFPFGFGLEAH
jgi:beta-glucosidase